VRIFGSSPGWRPQTRPAPAGFRKTPAASRIPAASEQQPGPAAQPVRPGPDHGGSEHGRTRWPWPCAAMIVCAHTSILQVDAGLGWLAFGRSRACRCAAWRRIGLVDSRDLAPESARILAGRARSGAAPRAIGRANRWRCPVTRLESLAAVESCSRFGGSTRRNPLTRFWRFGLPADLVNPRRPAGTWCPPSRKRSRHDWLLWRLPVGGVSVRRFTRTAVSLVQVHAARTSPAEASSTSNALASPGKRGRRQLARALGWLAMVVVSRALLTCSAAKRPGLISPTLGFVCLPPASCTLVSAAAKYPVKFCSRPRLPARWRGTGARPRW